MCVYLVLLYCFTNLPLDMGCRIGNPAFSNWSCLNYDLGIVGFTFFIFVVDVILDDGRPL